METVHGLVNWFEIPVKDIERAKTFYKKVFNVSFVDLNMPTGGGKMAMFPMPQKGKIGVTGALVAADYAKPSQDGSNVYFSCADLSHEAKKVEECGGKVIFPKTNIGENGYIAHFLDTEGNRVSLHSMK